MSKTLYLGGDVYSPADPFATAMLVDGDSVAWVGSDEAARAVGGDADVVDLDGSLITPAFVNALADFGSAGNDGSAQGVGTVHVAVGPDELESTAASTSDPTSGDMVVYLTAHVRNAADAIRWKRAAPHVTGLVGETADVGDIAAHLKATTSTDLQARFSADDDDELGRILRGYDAAADVVGASILAAAGHRVDLGYAATDDLIAAVNSRRLTVVVRPGAGSSPARTGSMISAGIPVAFGSLRTGDAIDPWGTVRAAVFADDENERISARAAFTAHTRGGWRAARSIEDGALVPGAPASFARWAPTDLSVQVADERIAAWSTDPRSGTPGLPDLTDPDFRPTCLATVSHGRRIYAAEAGEP